ncbi:TRAP transporter large permease [Chloroflexota bacterium]
MSPAVMSLILIGGLILLLALGSEIYVAMGVVAAIGLIIFVGQPLKQFAFTAFDVMNSFEMTAVPLFVFMGAIFFSTGVIRNLFNGANKLIGIVPGGVAASVLGANGIFGAISGSSLAAVATFGKIAYPEMERLGYDPKLALGSLAIGGTLSQLIPPSLILIVYGGWQSLSVARLFAAALVPGIILTILLIFTVILMVLIKPNLAPAPLKVSWHERLRAFLDLIPFLVIITFVLGAVFSGIMTPTESAAIGAALSILLAAAYRSMSWAALKESMWQAVKVASMIALIIFTARVLAQVFNYIGLTDAFSTFMIGLPMGRHGILVIICLMYIIMGMFLDSLSMMVLTLPFVGPLMSDLGFNPVWFGVVFTILTQVGLVTPPFGLNLFVLQSVVPSQDIMTIAKGCMPFLVAPLVVILLLVLAPEISLWLPKLMFG